MGFYKKLDNKAQSLLRPEGLYVGELCAHRCSDWRTHFNFGCRHRHITLKLLLSTNTLGLSPNTYPAHLSNGSHSHHTLTDLTPWQSPWEAPPLPHLIAQPCPITTHSSSHAHVLPLLNLLYPTLFLICNLLIYCYLKGAVYTRNIVSRPYSFSCPYV